VRELMERAGIEPEQLRHWWCPRCPQCGGALTHKPFSLRLVCLRCGREYVLREVGGGSK